MPQLTIFDLPKEVKSYNYAVFTTDGHNRSISKKFENEFEAIRYRDECEKWDNHNIYKYEVEMI